MSVSDLTESRNLVRATNRPSPDTIAANAVGSRNSNRRKMPVAKVPLVGSIEMPAKQMSNFLDARIAFRLPIVLAGAMLAGCRRTASRWFRADGGADD